MIKLVIFDLYGVLIDSKQTHYEALNRALGEEYAISIQEHLAIYDGLPTRSKLYANDPKGLPWIVMVNSRSNKWQQLIY